ncbi:hypothetical protein DL96DRAFT_1592735 [Flagelloscypha sp. PMI_526]|nr:hypothetical protein DL96DRAFT_1592735 [Flagelloscypha sp. PMI_526]
MSDANIYEITLADVSPVLTYSPYRDIDNPGAGWKLVYSESPDSSYDATHKTDNEGKGTSLHMSTMTGATMSLDFYGSGITVYGSSSAGAFSTTVDSQETTGSPSGTKLFETTNLSVGKHTMSLKVSNGKGVNVTSVVVKAAVGKSGSTVVPLTEDAVSVSSGSPVTSSYYSTSGGEWYNVHSWEKYPRLDTNTIGGTVSFSFSNASGLIIYGTSNYDHDTFSVKINPPVGASTSERTFNATSKWFAYDNVVFFEAGMDASTTYNVQLKNLGTNKYLDIHSTHILQTISSSSNGGSSSGSSGSSSSSSGGGLQTPAIVGIAVGVAALVIILAILGVLWKRQNRDRRESRQKVTIEGKGGFDHPAPTPFGSQNAGLPYNGTAPQESGRLLSEYSVSPYHPSPPSSSAGFAGAGIIPASKWSQHMPHSPDPHASMHGSSAYASSSAGGSDGYARETMISSLSSQPLLPPPGASTDKAALAANANNPRPPPRQEIDAGPAPEPQQEAETLPPGYNPQWSNPGA